MAAADIREVLGKFVPQAVLDEAVEEIKNTEIAPEWFRTEAAASGGKVKELEAELKELRPLKEAPVRAEAFKPFGIDYEKAPRFLKRVLDEVPAEDLENQDKIAQHLRENDVEVNLQGGDNSQRERRAPEQISDFLSSSGSTPQTQSYEEAVASAKDQSELDEVYKRFGKEPATT